jgi:hypothetical protein
VGQRLTGGGLKHSTGTMSPADIREASEKASQNKTTSTNTMVETLATTATSLPASNSRCDA